MSQPFSFPPPPPPPPKHVNNGDQYQQPPFRGRGGLHGQQYDRGRGRGQYSQRVRGDYGNRGNGMNQHFSQGNRGQKRNHTTAFNGRTDAAARNHRPAAPPAVPSFGLDLGSLLPKKPPVPQASPKGPAKKANLLGLTPAGKGDESEEDDAEEESKLAGIVTSGNILQVEYKGETSTLNTPEEIAAWIAERRKKWPTEAKREVAKHEAEEKWQKWEAEKVARMEASKAAAKARWEDRQKQKLEREKSQVRQKLLREQLQKAQSSTPKGTQTPAQVKAERLRKRAAKIAQQLQAAETELEETENAAPVDDKAAEPDLELLLAQVDAAAAGHDVTSDIELDDSDGGTSSDSDMPIHDDTSTSGSSSESDTDSDAAPEQLSSKRTAPDRVMPPARKAVSDSATDNRPLCKNLQKYGRCKFGKKCHFKHEMPGRKEESKIGHRRKGLYQIMVQKEQEEERRKALRAIIALGDAGLLNEPADNPASDS